MQVSPLMRSDVIVKQSSCQLRQEDQKQNNIPILLQDTILQELNSIVDSTPVPSGNIDSFLHGDFELLLSVREEVRRSVQKAVSVDSRKRKRSNSNSSYSVNPVSQSSDNSSTTNQDPTKSFDAWYWRPAVIVRKSSLVKRHNNSMTISR